MGSWHSETVKTEEESLKEIFLMAFGKEEVSKSVFLQQFPSFKSCEALLKKSITLADFQQFASWDTQAKIERKKQILKKLFFQIQIKHNGLYANNKIPYMRSTPYELLFELLIIYQEEKKDQNRNKTKQELLLEENLKINPIIFVKFFPWFEIDLLKFEIDKNMFLSYFERKDDQQDNQQDQEKDYEPNTERQIKKILKPIIDQYEKWKQSSEVITPQKLRSMAMLMKDNDEIFEKYLGTEEKQKKFINTLSPNHLDELYIQEFEELAYWVEFVE